MNSVVHSAPERQLLRSNGRPDDELFFDMDGMDESEPRDNNSTLKMTQSDDEDDVDNDDSQCGRYFGIAIKKTKNKFTLPSNAIIVLYR